MKYRIICTIDIEAGSKEEATNIVNEQLQGKARMFVDYFEELERYEYEEDEELKGGYNYG